MRALVISGGGSKGAFAGGVAQFLTEDLGRSYELYIGTSTGSLLVNHLALRKADKIRKVYTSVTDKDIFSVCPFVIRKKDGGEQIAINHLNVIRNFMRGSKTFGESEHLKQLIRRTFTREEFEILKNQPVEVVVTVSNLSLNQVEYISIRDFDYESFTDWIWISCNYTPFMTLARRNGCEYADGGMGCMVPVEEAVRRGATEVDAIILQTEVTQLNRLPSRNPFDLLTNMFAFMLDRIERQNIRIGKFVANRNDAIINFYYTPTVLTTNSLIFNKKRMSEWWERGYEFARLQSRQSSEL